MRRLKQALSVSLASAAPGATTARHIETSILKAMPPAVSLGIGVDSIEEDSGQVHALSLSAPLKGNTNVHGTAFAGSLFAVGVLTSYYLVGEWLQRRGVDLAAYDVVAKDASIAYKRPASAERIVARSSMPSTSTLSAFEQELLTRGKATLPVPGRVMKDQQKVAVEYTINVCVYKKRKPDGSA